MKQTFILSFKILLLLFALTGFFKLDAQVSQPIQPNPIPSFSVANGSVNTVVWDSIGNKVFIGGSFSQVGVQARAKFAVMDATTGALLPWNLNFNGGAIMGMCLYKGMLYVGGTFTSVGGQPRISITKLNLSTQTVTSWTPNIGGTVHDIVAKGNFIYVGGTFSGSSPNLCRIDTGTGVLDAWNSNLAGTGAYDLDIYNTDLYVSGNFTNAGGLSRNNAAVYNNINATPTIDASWDPSPDQQAGAIAYYNGLVYLGGNFTLAGGQARNYFACVNPSGTAGTATTLNLSLSSTCNAIAIKNNLLYAAGYYTTVTPNGGFTYNRNGLLEYDLGTNQLTTWNPNQGGVFALATGTNKLYAAGVWSTFFNVFCTNFSSPIEADISFSSTLQSNACAGQTGPGSVSVDNLSGATSYNWTNTLSGVTVNPLTSNAVTMSFTAAAVGTNTVTVFGTNGCINTNTLSTTIDVYKFLSSVSAMTSGYNPNVSGTITCGGADTLKATGNYIGSGSLSYTWAPAASLSAPNGSFTGSYPVANTQYTLTAKSSDGCMATDTLTEFVVNFNLNVTANSSSILCSATDTLKATNMYPGVGTVTYTWSPVSSLNISNPAKPVANPITTTDYTVMASVANGCKANPQTINVTVNAITANTGANPSSLTCGNTSTLSVNTDYPGAGIISYTWSPAGDLNNSHLASPVANPTTSTNYVISISTPEGCTASNSTNITVNPLQVTTSGHLTTSCKNPVTLNTFNNSSNPGLVFTWSPSTGLSNIHSASPVANAGMTTIYTVIMSLPSTGCVAANAVDTVKVNAPPVPNICMVTTDSLSQYNVIYWDKTGYIPTDSFIMYREVTTNTYSRIGSVSYNSLSQFTDMAQSIGPANGNPNIGTYRYKISAKDSCGNESARSPYHNTVYFVDNHTGTFTWNTYSVENMTVTPVTQFDLLRDSSNTGSWHVIGTVAGTQTTLNDPTYALYQNIGNWRVAALGFTCTPTMRYGNNSVTSTVVKSKSNITNNRTTAINSFENNFSIYPNPTDGKISINLGHISSGKVTVKITSLLGQEVYNETLIQPADSYSVDMSNYQGGTYIVRVITINKSVTQKIIRN